MLEIIEREKQKESILLLAKPKPLKTGQKKPQKNLLSAEKDLMVLFSLHSDESIDSDKDV